MVAEVFDGFTVRPMIWLGAAFLRWSWRRLLTETPDHHPKVNLYRCNYYRPGRRGQGIIFARGIVLADFIRHLFSYIGKDIFVFQSFRGGFDNRGPCLWVESDSWRRCF